MDSRVDTVNAVNGVVLITGTCCFEGRCFEERCKLICWIAGAIFFFEGNVGVCMDGKRAVRNVKDVLTVMLYMILCCVSWLTSYKVVCVDVR